MLDLRMVKCLGKIVDGGVGEAFPFEPLQPEGGGLRSEDVAEEANEARAVGNTKSVGSEGVGLTVEEFWALDDFVAKDLELAVAARAHDNVAVRCGKGLVGHNRAMGSALPPA